MPPSHSQELIASYLEPMMNYLVQLEVYEEMGIPDADTGTKVRFAYNNWREDLPYLVRKNGVGLTYATQYTASFTQGFITLASSLVEGDEVRASYRWRYFTRNDLKNFLEITIRELNGRKPISAYTIEDAPTEWDAGLVMGAYLRMLERVALEIHTWRGGMIWRDPVQFSSYLNAEIAAVRAHFLDYAKHLKRRGLIRVFGVSSGKYFVSQQCNEVNFRRYTFIGNA